MKYFILSAISAAVVLTATLFGNQASAQVGGAPRTVAPPPRAAAGAVALLDVNYLFDNHPRFKRMMTEMKGDVQRAEEQVKVERDNIRKLYEKLDQFKGTPDYKAMEEEAAKRENDLKLQIALQRKEFVQREARIYYNVYQEIQQEVDYYCKQNGIDLVLQFNGTPVDVENPESVLKHINKLPVYYAQDRDITPIIRRNLEARGGGAQPVNPGTARGGIGVHLPPK